MSDARRADPRRGLRKRFEAIIAAGVGPRLPTGCHGSAIGAHLGATCFGLELIDPAGVRFDRDWSQDFPGTMVVVSVPFNNATRKRLTREHCDEPRYENSPWRCIWGYPNRRDAEDREEHRRRRLIIYARTSERRAFSAAKERASGRAHDRGDRIHSPTRDRGADYRRAVTRTCSRWPRTRSTGRLPRRGRESASAARVDDPP